MTAKFKNLILLSLIALAIGAISPVNSKAQDTATLNLAKDIHSYANPETVRVTNVDLDWTVLFDKKILQGSATLNVAPMMKGTKLPLFWTRAI